MKTKISIRLATMISSLLIISQLVAAQSFTIPVLPDTQVETGSRPEMFFSQMNWIAAKRDSLKIPIVLHVGDLVNFDNNNHYENASKGYDILDKVNIPYAIALGNHDTRAVGMHSGSAAPGDTHANVRLTDKFNAYFPQSRFKNQRGSWEKGKSDNSYYTFQAGGYNWLVVTLEFCARPEPVDWAAKIIPQYPNHNVIVVTHYHLNPNGEINKTNAGYGDLSPQQIYDRIIKKFPNVCMVLSGHVVASASRVDVGDNGNNIFQILQDYQHEDSGGGYIRLLDIDPVKGTIGAKMYSPFYNKTKQDSSQFKLSNLKLIPIDRKLD